MTIDVRARQAGTLFSMGVEDEAAPVPRRGVCFGLPRGLWSGLGAAWVLRGRRTTITTMRPQAVRSDQGAMRAVT